MERSLVSVVMCTYNGSKYVEQQLNSIICQTYPLYEILIFDDCSTDDTVKKIKTIADEHSVINVTVNHVNIGFSKNFENALQHATGEVIAIADQDDIWMCNKIEKLIHAWKEDCPLIYCDSYVFKNQLPDKPKPKPKYRRFEGSDARKLFYFNTVSGHAVMMRRNFVSLIMPFADGIYYDWWAAVVAAYNGGVQYHPETLVLQRQHESNITIEGSNGGTKAIRRSKHKELVVTHLKVFKNAPGMPADYKNFAEQLLIHLQRSQLNNFYIPLFLFMLKHSRLLFNFKIRKVGFISYIKHSYILSFK